MTTHGATTLRELANNGDAVRRVLDRAGLDYCCHGATSLAEACRVAGLGLSAIEAELRDAGEATPRDLAHRGLTELLDYVLGVVHPRTKRLLVDLASAADTIPAHAKGAQLHEACNVLISHAELQMSEEENVLFARVRALANARKGRGPFPPVLRPLHENHARLREGHATTHEYLRRASALAEGITGPAGEELRTRIDAASRSLTEQIHLENNELVPRALELEPDEGAR